jgi:hypothetical protein
VTPASSPAALLGAVGDHAHIDDQLYLRARLVELCFERAFDAKAAGVWHAPSTLRLLGGRSQGPSLSLATHWRAMVAASAREDRTVRIHLLGSGDETVELSLDDERTDGDAPREAVSIARVLRALARRGHLRGGIDMLRATDLPAGVGLDVDASVRAATARAVCGLSGAGSRSGTGAAELAAALDEAWGRPADHLLCMTGAEGFVALSRPGPAGERRLDQLPCVRFDPARHRFRLTLVTLRTAPGSPAPTGWEPPEAEDTLAEECFRLLAGQAGDAPEAQLGACVGALLDAAHAAGLSGRERVAVDLIVTAARDAGAGALGARALSSRAMVAAVATTDLGTVRRAILAACAEQPGTSLGARFLTTAGAAGAGQGAGAVDRIEQ